MTRTVLIALGAGALALLLTSSAAASDKRSVTDLVGELPKCQSLETCDAVKRLLALGDGIWPELEVGLKATDEMTKFWTLGVLSERPIPAARTAIAARLDDSFIRVRAAAAYALGAQRDKAVTKPLLKALADKDLNVRFAAAVGLARIKDPASVDGLLVACRDQDEDVRAHAAMALGDIGDRRAVPRLIERMEQDIHPKVRGYAAMALGSLKDPKSLKPLLAQLGYEKDAKALAAAIFAVGQIGSKADIPALKRHEKHASADVREFVSDALAAINKRGK